MKPKVKYIVVALLLILLSFLIYLMVIYFFISKPKVIPETEYNPFGLKEEEVLIKPVTLLFVGDIMLDRTIRKDGEQYGYDTLFACLEEKFSQYNLVIGNLEGTVTSSTSVSRDAPYEHPDSFRFTFDIIAIEALKDVGLDIVSLANNHIKDFGSGGIIQTTENLTNLGINFFGNPITKQERWFIKEVEGIKIAFIPYNEFFGTQEETLEDLKEVKDISDIQILFAHWGDEYVPVRENTRIFAHQLIDEGMDLVIGAHPHIIQEHEIYKNSHIYYSLGNFIFDQYFQPEVMEGLAVGIKIMNNKIIGTEEYKIESKRHEGSCFVK